MDIEAAKPVVAEAIRRSSQNRVARAIGVAGSVLSRWMGGTSTPEGASREKIIDWAEEQSAKPPFRTDSEKPEPPVVREAPAHPYGFKLGDESDRIARRLESAKRTLAEMREAADAQEAVVERLHGALIETLVRETLGDVERGMLERDTDAFVTTQPIPNEALDVVIADQKKADASAKRRRKGGGG